MRRRGGSTCAMSLRIATNTTAVPTFASLVIARLACLGTVNRGSTSMSFPALALLACLAVTQGDGRWSAAAPLPEPVQELSAAVLHGRIYVAGGFDRTGAPTAAAFRYDPVANQWERVADLPAARHHMPLAAVGDTLYAVDLPRRPEPLGVAGAASCAPRRVRGGSRERKTRGGGRLGGGAEAGRFD